MLLACPKYNECYCSHKKLQASQWDSIYDYTPLSYDLQALRYGGVENDCNDYRSHRRRTQMEKSGSSMHGIRLAIDVNAWCVYASCPSCARFGPRSCW